MPRLVGGVFFDTDLGFESHFSGEYFIQDSDHDYEDGIIGDRGIQELKQCNFKVDDP
jgi:hypothetical protein